MHTGQIVCGGKRIAHQEARLSYHSSNPTKKRNVPTCSQILWNRAVEKQPRKKREASPMNGPIQTIALFVLLVLSILSHSSSTNRILRPRLPGERDDFFTMFLLLLWKRRNGGDVKIKAVYVY
jgi:hypothetical protein